jgi:hypothetical protein
MSNSKKMTAEEVRVEVNKLQKQMDDLIKNYCSSISPYNIGDKVLNPYGKLVIINEIEPIKSFFFEPEKYRDLSPFHYNVQELRKDGKPKVYGHQWMFVYLNEISGEVNINPY